MSDQAVLLPKLCTLRGVILAKGQLGHSYNFWTTGCAICLWTIFRGCPEAMGWCRNEMLSYFFNSGIYLSNTIKYFFCNIIHGLTIAFGLFWSKSSRHTQFFWWGQPLQPQGCQKIFMNFQIIQFDYFCWNNFAPALTQPP